MERIDQKLDQLIKESFSASFMNNTKWLKLVERLTDAFDNPYVDYKLVTSSKIDNCFLFNDYYNWFYEPILFKEVEWVCFPKECEIIHGRRITRKIKKNYTQDIDQIEQIILEIGQFILEKTDDYLKVYAYR
ncbi:MAG: hypothetical protein HRT68_06290 [Flavobacteriaceae bacterium]|nr:hypothetical protein [Flavobacteriaceae bacterium]